MRGWFAGFALMIAVPVAASPAEDAAAVRWLQASGHPLSGPDPLPAELDPIAARLAGARVIGLGEVTHGTHEDVAFKASLFRRLVEIGAVTTLVIEANRVVGTGFDGYVRNGVGDLASLITSPSAFKMFKNDEFAGMLLWVRAWNLAHPEQMVGVVAIDDQDGVTDAVFALDFVARQDAALANLLRDGFGPILKSAGTARQRPSDWIAKNDRAEAIRLLAAATSLQTAFQEHAKQWGSAPGFKDAAYAAKVARQNFHVFELDVAGADLSKTPPDYQSRRDRYMAENLIEQLGAGRRAALWAHNAHVMHTLPAAWSNAGYLSLGTELRRTLGDSYRTVAFTYTRATVLATRSKDRSLPQLLATKAQEPIPLINEGPNTTGTALARLKGDAWWFDLTTLPTGTLTRAWSQQPRWHGEVGWLVDPATFQRGDVNEDGAPFGTGYDILVWFRSLSPQHRWPGVH